MPYDRVPNCQPQSDEIESGPPGPTSRGSICGMIEGDRSRSGLHLRSDNNLSRDIASAAALIFPRIWVAQS